MAEVEKERRESRGKGEREHLKGLEMGEMYAFL